MTTWTGDGLTAETARRPKICDDFVLASCTDAPTNQPAENITPDPNVLIVEITCAPAVYDAIYDHPDYGQGAIQWSIEI